MLEKKKCENGRKCLERWTESKGGFKNRGSDEEEEDIYRELDDATKEKISKSNQGKPKSASHKFHISQAMTKYWQGIPNKPQSTSTDEEDEQDK